MPSIKDLKKRITSVKNTQQTTRAMKMVSAAKLRRAQEAITSQRPYAKQVAALIQKLAASKGEGTEAFPVLKRSSDQKANEKKKVLLVLVTSDRGLCGAFNGNIIKIGQKWIQSHGNQNSASELQLAFVGRKGYEYFKTKNQKIAAYYSEEGGKVTFLKAKKLATSLVELYTSGQVDEIKIAYNEFKNAATQAVVVEDFLPLSSSHEIEEKASGTSDSNVLNESNEADIGNYIIKPSVDEVIQDLLSKHFAIQTFRILLESQAGEHGARMSSMENATKNAGEMIRKLTLVYNKQRQAGITKELLEIIAGSESQKG